MFLLTLERDKGGEEGEKHQSVASHTRLDWGLYPHPRYVP